jgi:peroxiredoxin
VPLQPGDPAPDVRLPADSGEQVSFTDFRGRQPVLVLFFPLAFTSTCTEELCMVGDDLAAYRALRAQLLAVSVDSPYVLARYRRECGVDFPFLSDFHREAAEAFGVIRYAWISRDPGLLPPFEEIKRRLQGV